MYIYIYVLVYIYIYIHIYRYYIYIYNICIHLVLRRRASHLWDSVTPPFASPTEAAGVLKGFEETFEAHLAMS